MELILASACLRGLPACLGFPLSPPQRPPTVALGRNARGWGEGKIKARGERSSHRSLRSRFLPLALPLPPFFFHWCLLTGASARREGLPAWQTPEKGTEIRRLLAPATQACSMNNTDTAVQYKLGNQHPLIL